MANGWSIVLHGGCTNTTPSDHHRNAVEEALGSVLREAVAKVKQGAKARDVVVQIVAALEDCPLFNAGKGSALTANGTHELEAGIVDGHSGAYGAVGCTTTIKNPILAANALLENGPHPVLVGPQADEASKHLGLDTVDNEYFTTPTRKAHLECKMRGEDDFHESNLGTVGAVVLDVYGHLAAGGSTGGTTGKHAGRIGDTSILGAGLYADASISVVCSGAGDQILQHTIASRVATRHDSGSSLHSAAHHGVERMSHLKKPCAVAAINADGDLVWASSAAAFYIASASSRHAPQATTCPQNVPSVSGVSSDVTFVRQVSPDERIKAPQAWKHPSDQVSRVLKEPWFSTLLELQDALFHSSVDFFGNRLGYKYGLVPVTTDAISSPMGLGSDSLPVAISLFGNDTHLADSMQFTLEYLLRIAEGSCGVYYVGCSFRGEDSDPMHLNQFYHVECELRGNMSDGISVAERYLVHTISGLLKGHARAIRAVAGTTDHLESFLSSYIRNGKALPQVTLDSALDIIGTDEEVWSYVVPSDPNKGRQITRRGEQRLMEHFGGPVWVTEMDHQSVPFYQAYTDGNNKKAKCADLLLGFGETLGLGERHMDAQGVYKALDQHEVPPEPYNWYINMRDAVPLQTAGWGMGTERFLAWVLQHNDIRDLAIIPRLKGQTFAP